jgi:hypothetical protein
MRDIARAMGIVDNQSGEDFSSLFSGWSGNRDRLLNFVCRPSVRYKMQEACPYYRKAFCCVLDSQ